MATDISQFIAVTVSATAEEVAADRLEAARAAYLVKQPHVSGFAASADTAIIQVTVGRYDVKAHFQVVTILEIQVDSFLTTMPLTA